MKTRSTHLAVDGISIECGLPSPGSRLQSLAGYEHLRPASNDSVLITKDPKLTTCKRCLKIFNKRKIVTNER